MAWWTQKGLLVVGGFVITSSEDVPTRIKTFKTSCKDYPNWYWSSIQALDNNYYWWFAVNQFQSWQMHSKFCLHFQLPAMLIISLCARSASLSSHRGWCALSSIIHQRRQDCQIRYAHDAPRLHWKFIWCAVLKRSIAHCFLAVCRSGRSHFFKLRLRSCSKIFESWSGFRSGIFSNLRIRLLFRLRVPSSIQPKFTHLFT